MSGAVRRFPLVQSDIIQQFLVTDESQLQDPVHQVLYRYWRSKHQEAGLPGRGDLDPVDFFPFLPSLMLVDVLDQEGRRRLRFRLMGSYHIEITGQDMTGKYFDEALTQEADRDRIISRYATAVDLKTPHYWKRNFWCPEKRWRYYQSIILPLASDGTNVDMILSVVAFEGQ